MPGIMRTDNSPITDTMVVPSSYYTKEVKADSSSDYRPRRKKNLTTRSSSRPRLDKCTSLTNDNVMDLDLDLGLDQYQLSVPLNKEGNHLDQYQISIPPVKEDKMPFSTKGGVRLPFPAKLYYMLQYFHRHEPEVAKIISWQPHGRCFMTHDVKRMEEFILPRFFNHRQYSSFRRNLNIWGFKRLTQNGSDHGAYYHDLFLRGKPSLCHGIKRLATKTTSEVARRFRVPGKPETEPKFDKMDPLPPPSPSPDDISLSASSTSTSFYSSSSNGTSTSGTTKKGSEIVTSTTQSAIDAAGVLDGGLGVSWDCTAQEGRTSSDEQKRNTAWQFSNCLSSYSSIRMPRIKYLQVKKENTSKGNDSDSAGTASTLATYESRAHNGIGTKQDLHSFGCDKSQEGSMCLHDSVFADLTPMDILSPPMTAEDKKDMAQLLARIC